MGAGAGNRHEPRSCGGAVRFLLVSLLALFALLALTPPVPATDPLPPWEATVHLRGEPLVGQTVELVAEVLFHSPVDQQLALEASAGIDVLEGARQLQGGPGDRQSLSWQLQIRNEGPWDAALTGPTGWCCLRGWSTPDAGAWAQPGDPAPWPAPEITFGLQIELLDDQTVQLLHTATASGWAAQGNLSLSVTGPDGHTVEGFGKADAPVVQELQLADGGGLVITRTVAVQWPFVRGLAVAATVCENVEFERNGGARPIDGWSCEVAQTSAVPQPLALAAISLVAVAWARRARRHHR